MWKGTNIKKNVFYCTKKPSRVFERGKIEIQALRQQIHAGTCYCEAQPKILCHGTINEIEFEYYVCFFCVAAPSLYIFAILYQLLHKRYRDQS